MQTNLENYYTMRDLTTSFIICNKSLAHDNISQRSAWMLLCSPIEVAPIPCGVISLFTPHTEEPQGRTELLCCPELHWHTLQAPPALRKENWCRDQFTKEDRDHVQGQQLGDSRFSSTSTTLPTGSPHWGNFIYKCCSYSKSPMWQQVTPPTSPAARQAALQAFLSRMGSGNVAPWSNLDTIEPPRFVSLEDTPHFTTCDVPMPKCNWMKTQRMLRLHWTCPRGGVLVSAVYIYTSVFREQQCPLVLRSLYAWGEVSSYTNLLQGDTQRSDFLREIMKSRTFWQGAEMSVWQADRLLYHNLIHPVRVWEDVFDELATQISKEFLACAWSSHTSGIKIHLEWEDHSLSMTPFALAWQFMTQRCLKGWVERGMSAIIQGKQMQSDKAVPLAPLSKAAETAPITASWWPGQKMDISILFSKQRRTVGEWFRMLPDPRQWTKSFFWKSL